MSTEQGDLIRDLREARNWSQKELGEKVGASERTIWAIENVGHSARKRVMTRIREELGIEGDQEMARSEMPTRVQVVVAAIADLLFSLPEDERRAWVDDLSLRVINDDARFMGRPDWPHDVQLIATMLGAYLTRED